MSRGVTELGSRDAAELVTADMDTDITDSVPEFLLPGVRNSEDEDLGSVA